MKDAFKNAKCPGTQTEARTEKDAAALHRETAIYRRNNDIRSEFERDYTRLLHCQAFRRLKHKTQVFFAPKNDHICTRMEHVLHVESVAGTIAKHLGLNDRLTSAIAIGHDIGHAPFGHHGEDCLNDILNGEGKPPATTGRGKTDAKRAADAKKPLKKFWHERNSLFFADYIETLPDTTGIEQPLDLTYAVRDGLICHCGEIDVQGIKPREDNRDLYTIKAPGIVQPFTWEGCVVKTADKIAYLGRDLEDARQYRILDMTAYRRLKEIVDDCIAGLQSQKQAGEKTADIPRKKPAVNTTVLINDLIVDLCRQSSPENGLCFSPEYFNFIKELKKFSFTYIYSHWRLLEFQHYARCILKTIWRTLLKMHPFAKTGKIRLALQFYPKLRDTWEEWLIKYTAYRPHDIPARNGNGSPVKYPKYNTKQVFDISDEESYRKCAIEYISGMTDLFAIQVFEEIISF